MRRAKSGSESLTTSGYRKGGISGEIAKTNRLHNVYLYLSSPNEQRGGGGALPDFFFLSFFPVQSRSRAELSTV